jgi:SpoVK/Ycf46/Vps4 family AAA+-type ATPase
MAQATGVRQIFISYVEEDESIALEIAQGLEEAGYTTWYYKRDSKLFRDFLTQVFEAIEQAQGIVLLISYESLSSIYMDRELVGALESRKLCAPVLHNITYKEFQQHKPKWALALGATTSIEIPQEGVHVIVPKLVDDLKSLGIQPQPETPKARAVDEDHLPTLAEEIERRGPFTPDEAVHLAIELCCELERGHDAGLSHTPLDAESVLYIGGDIPTVQVIEAATVPAKGDQDAERASDALGVGRLLYEMLTKTVPDDSPSPPSPANPEVSSALDRIVLQSLTTGAFPTPEALEQRLRIHLDGKGLLEILEREGHFSIEECIWQTIRLCNQIEHHHAQGRSHHNLTSINVVLVDVGNKRHARWIEMAVLSAEDDTADGEATDDVHAVGAILYEMLTGHAPLLDGTEPALLSEAESYARLGLDRIVLKALAPEPAERYCDVVILRERLYHHLPRLQQVKEIDTLIRAGYPIIYIVSWEEERVAALLHQIAKMQEKPFYSWTLSQGVRDAKGRRPRGATRLENPAAVLNHVIRAKEDALYVLFDFHPFLRQTHYDDVIRRRMRDLATEIHRSPKALVIVAPTLEIPPECEKDITVIHFGLPTPGEIADVLDDTIVLIQKSGGRVELPSDDYEELVRSATGLTLREAERAFTLAWMRKAVEQNQRVLDRDAIEIVLGEKEHALYKSSALEIFSSPEDFGDIGGLDALKEWAEKRARAFTIEAQDFGLPAPKGVLLIGVPGCGKSLAAKTIASEWKKPLLRLNAGALFSSRMGSSEENLRNALQVAEAIAPSILWIDEIEKSFSGIHTIDDGGVTARVLGGLVTWLQEKNKPVFVVATANSIGDPSPPARSQGYARSGGLPPELLRKGRFDELFFVDLPDHEERKQIFEIHLRKRGHDPSIFDLDELAEKSEDYSGAEIEQAVLSALHEAFYGLNRLYKLVQPALERLNEEAASVLKDFSEAELEEGWRFLLTEEFSEGASTAEKPRAAGALQNLFERFMTEWPVERLLSLMTSELRTEETTMGLSQQAILRSLKQIYPLSLTMRPQIEALRQWAKDNARSASRPPEHVPDWRREQRPFIDVSAKGG